MSNPIIEFSNIVKKKSYTNPQTGELVDRLTQKVYFYISDEEPHPLHSFNYFPQSVKTQDQALDVLVPPGKYFLKKSAFILKFGSLQTKKNLTLDDLEPAHD